MDYRHAFHAGNFADVFKHVILVRLLTALAREDDAFAYVETHAGRGRYDLDAPEPRTSGEYRDGVARLWDTPVETEGGVGAYLEAVRALNRGRMLCCYPGSPHIAGFMLRPQDRMRLAEQAPGECAQLRAELARDRRVTVHCGDGYAMLKVWLPPPERRGMVLIDPPYGGSDEWMRVKNALVLAAERWPQGTCAVWYPLKAGAPLARFKTELAQAGLPELLQAEMTVAPGDVPFRLHGCGMLILNPPRRFEAGLEAMLGALTERLRQGPQAGARVEWLEPNEGGT